ncbi:MFS transporter [Propionibacterium freudenreichii]|nr:MFS transporter [Propionibacterium freudenreichii]
MPQQPVSQQPTSQQPVNLEDVGMSRALRKVVVFSSGGPFLEGYVLGIIGVALVHMGPDLGINEHWSGLLGAAALVGVFVGAIAGGWVTDLIGRRKMFVIDLILIGVLSLLCMVVSTPGQLFVLRLAIGVVIGADYPIATSMIAEFTPRKYRAMAMGAIAAVWYLGANVAYVVGYLFDNVTRGWTWMLGSSVIPCVIILIGRWSVPESPRWLYSKGRTEEAAEVVRGLYGQDVELGLQPEPTRTKFSKVFSRPYLWRVLFVGVIWLCQAIPMFAMYTYGPQISNAFRLGEGRNALLGEMVVGTFFLIGTIPAMFLAESLGRRKLVIGSFAVMTVALAVLGAIPAPSTLVILICFALYALFSGGPGNLQWLYPNELFPTDIRGSAMGVAMAVSRIGTVVSIYILPGFIARQGMGATMIAGAIISAVGFVVSLVWAPETRGHDLSETSAPQFKGR